MKKPTSISKVTLYCVRSVTEKGALNEKQGFHYDLYLFFYKFKNEMSTLKMILVWQFCTAPVDVRLERDDCKFTELFGDA